MVTAAEPPGIVPVEIFPPSYVLVVEFPEPSVTTTVKVKFLFASKLLNVKVGFVLVSVLL